MFDFVSQMNLKKSIFQDFFHFRDYFFTTNPDNVDNKKIALTSFSSKNPILLVYFYNFMTKNMKVSLNMNIFQPYFKWCQLRILINSPYLPALKLKVIIP